MKPEEKRDQTPYTREQYERGSRRPESVQDDPAAQAPRGMRLWFGIFMIIIYVGVGILFIIPGVFSIDNRVVSSIIGGLLCAYGVWRGYRLYRGMR